MENCLIQKLKATVDNNNIDYAEGFKISVDIATYSSHYNGSLSPAGDISPRIKSLNEKLFYTGTESQTGVLEGNTAYLRDTGHYELLVSNRITTFNMRAEGNGNKAVFDYNRLLNMKQLIYVGGHGDVSFGNIEDFSKHILLTTIALENCSNGTGNAKTLAELQVAAGRAPQTDETLTVKSNGNIYNGETRVANNHTITITFNASLPNGYSITNN